MSSQIQNIRSPKQSTQRFLLKLFVFLVILVLADHLLNRFLVAGLDRYFGLNIPAKILCVGHSHTELGIDDTALARDLHVPVAKYARSGANTADRLAMIKHYMERQPESVQVIVYDVDAHTFTGEGISKNSHTLFYPFMDSSSVDSYVSANADFIDYYLRKYVKARRFDEHTCGYSVRGWLDVRKNLKMGTANIERIRKAITRGDFRPISFDSECIDYFDETIKFVRDNNVKLVLLYIPTVDVYNNAEPEKYDEAIRMLESYAAKDDGVIFLNYNLEFASSHELFYDCFHLNSEGRKRVCEKLAKDLADILK